MGDVIPTRARFEGTPERAVVTPRSWIRPDGEVLPLEYLIRQLLDRGKRTLVSLHGPPGSGVSTAFAHLAAVVPDSRLLLFPQGRSPFDVWSKDSVAVMGDSFREHPSAIAIELAAWDADDIIEYLLAKHRTACKSVMSRIGDTTDALDGLPALWVPVLDLMAQDETIPDIESALGIYLRRLAGDQDTYDNAAAACMRHLGTTSAVPNVSGANPIWRVLRWKPAAHVLAAGAVAKIITAGWYYDFADKLPHAVVARAAKLLSPEARAGVEKWIQDKPQAQSFGCTLLVAGDPEWRPSFPPTELASVIAPGAHWPGISMPQCNLTAAKLAGADLSGANLYLAKARRIDLSRANLRGADLDRFNGDGGSLVGADLSKAKGFSASFFKAKADRANFENTAFLAAFFIETSLKEANFTAAYLREASFRHAIVEDASFSLADLTNSIWEHVDLREANVRNALFNGASIVSCNLEGMDLTDVEFSQTSFNNSYLTGTRMRGGSLRNASLVATGLAEVDWEGVDLRNVDFTHASFHLGSSRSGLVHSTIASEGTRTGFYTDDYNDRDYKPPEEIRKANLCRCDLRGAKVDKTDFYLVDLRGAIYTPGQARHFARCGAILADRA